VHRRYTLSPLSDIPTGAIAPVNTRAIAPVNTGGMAPKINPTERSGMSEPVSGERQIDQILVERAQAGDKHAFELLVAKYQRKLARLLSRFIRDAAELEDVSQEAFIKAYRALPSFRGESAFYTWLYRIAINTAKNFLVSQGRRAPTVTKLDADESENFEDADGLHDLNTPESAMLTKEIGQTVTAAMEALP
jgi:RNA polymerase sigma factor RpoE